MSELGIPVLDAGRAGEMFDDLWNRFQSGENTLALLPAPIEREGLTTRPGPHGVDVAQIELIADQLHSEYGRLPYGSDTERGVLEMSLVEGVHRLLRDVHIEVLTDRGFWRYLTFFPFRWFAIRRNWWEGSREAKNSWCITGDVTLWLLPRVFMWGAAAWDPRSDSYDTARAVTDSPIDFWHSFVIRGTHNRDPRVSQAFAREIAKGELEGHRELGYRLNELNRTVLFGFLDRDTVDQLVSEKAQAVKDAS